MTTTDKRNNAVGPQVRAKKVKSGKLTTPLLALLSLMAGLIAASQFFANAFQYQAALGPHYYKFYAPWSILKWAFYWHEKYPDEFARSASVGVIVGGLGLLAIILVQMVQTKMRDFRGVRYNMVQTGADWCRWLYQVCTR